MARRKTKASHTGAEEAPSASTEGAPVDSSELQTQQPVSEPTEPAGAEQSTDAGTPQRKWPDPVGRHRINLGDGRHLTLARSNRWQQMQIRFIPDRDDVDPRPSKEDTEFMKENGFRWRAEEMAWTKQLAKNTDENWAARGNSDLEAHKEFVELANRIRQRNGLEPVSGISSEGRAA